MEKKCESLKQNNFDRAFEHVLGIEGGVSDHKADRGGLTKFGITHTTLSNYLGRGVSRSDVLNMTLETAKAIYKKNYWDILSLDQVESYAVALCIFDQVVNWGTGPSVRRRIQSAVNRTNFDKLTVDGIIGAKSLSALNTNVPPKNFCLEFIFDAQDRYIRLAKSNRSQLVFISGWINRTQNLLTEALSNLNVRGA